MKKGAAIILVGLLLMLSAVGLADWTAKTTAAKVNVRQRPSSSSNIVTQIKSSGTIVTVEDESTDKSGNIWYKIVTSNGKSGYIRGDFLEPYSSFGTQTAVSSIDYQALYSDYFINNRQRDTGSVSGSFEVRDLDKDGIPEMILKYYGVYVYTTEGTDVIPLNVWMLVDDELVDTGKNYVEGDGTVYFAKNGQGMAVGTEGADILMYSYMRKIGTDLVEQCHFEIDNTNGVRFMANGEESEETDFIGIVSNFDVPEDSAIYVYSKGIAIPIPERTLTASRTSETVLAATSDSVSADAGNHSDLEETAEAVATPGEIPEGMEHNTLDYLNSIALEDIE